MTRVSGWEIAGEIAGMVTALAAAFAAFQAWKGLSTWRHELIGKRKAELAEEVLSGFYQTADAIKSIRSPLSFPEHESKDRERTKTETEDQTKALDAHYVPIARIEKRSEFFSDLLAKKYRMKALFGDEVDIPFNTLNKILNDIQNSAAGMMRSVKRGRRIESIEKLWDKWEDTIWGAEENDEIEKDILEAISQIETLCAPVLEARN